MIFKKNIHVPFIGNGHEFIACVQKVKDEKFLSQLGSRVRSVREANGLTQLDLGLLCNNHAEQIGRIERGQHNVTICSLLHIARALKVPLKELMDF